jgi:hypothetical protein
MDVDSLDVRSRFAASDASKQRAILRVLLDLVRPFGYLDSDVIEPSEFDRIANAVDAGFDTTNPGVGDLASQIATMPVLRAEDEPDGRGFYALGAIVEVLYIARSVAGEREAAAWALARADDLLGSADDDLGTDGREQLLRWVDGALRDPVPPKHAGLLAATSSMAEALKTGT